MQFSQIFGQHNVKEKLVQLVQHNRLSHALLFLGKEGSGDLSLAIAFAQYIMCTSTKERELINTPSLFETNTEDPNKTEKNVVDQKDSCGTCAACIKASKLIHPDIHFSYPIIPRKTGDKPVCTDYFNKWREFTSENPYGNVYDWLQFIDAENKQGNIPVKECDDITHKISLKAFEGRYKILIMWLPEYLGKEGNKLLKLIEEPPTDTIFLFVTENENAILPTILSRTQLIKIPALTNTEIEIALTSQMGISESKAKQIASVTDGNYKMALNLLQVADEDWQERARDWLKYINRQQIADQIKWIDEMAKLGREKQKQFLLYFIHLCEKAIRLNVLEEAGQEENDSFSLNISEAEMDFSTRLNKLCTLEAQEAIVQELNKACYYIERNAHAKMLFHALTIRLYYIIKDNSLILIN